MKPNFKLILLQDAYVRVALPLYDCFLNYTQVYDTHSSNTLSISTSPKAKIISHTAYDLVTQYGKTYKKGEFMEMILLENIGELMSNSKHSNHVFLFFLHLFCTT